ncbi:MAG: Asp-tRNA(Asn)/Glu-tRNA(Gln) amidotransferase GatCAB subunit C [bacterium]|nr:Asp-tRNA(Asn)/Glu-tRNA(Gln) amidotransferase GatCAB subunit C [bacterium]RIK51491.1 MAG: Asp-tRNA(Asn)/Glu-tRNA(Gln) amidotransferase GatCAB subunit C [Candidatus Microgenomates bacterium]
MPKKLILTDDAFATLIKQANVFLSDEEAKNIKNQLSEALDAVSILKELPTDQVGKTSSASGLSNVLREDVAQPSLTQEEALSNASVAHDGYFIVNSVFESQDN